MKVKKTSKNEVTGISYVVNKKKEGSWKWVIVLAYGTANVSHMF